MNSNPLLLGWTIIWSVCSISMFLAGFCFVLKDTHNLSVGHGMALGMMCVMLGISYCLVPELLFDIDICSPK